MSSKLSSRQSQAIVPGIDREESGAPETSLNSAQVSSPNISPDSATEFNLDSSSVPLSEDEPLTKEEKKEQEQEINPADIRMAAMNFLARREHSLHELQQKLKKRFDDIDLINTKLQRLVEENLQSDDRYAESYVRARSERGFGPVRIRQEMRDRGIDDQAVSQAMSCADIGWFAKAEDAYRKKFGANRAEDLKEKARRIRFMEYRGFTSEHFQHLLEEKCL